MSVNLGNIYIYFSKKTEQSKQARSLRQQPDEMIGNSRCLKNEMKNKIL